MKDFNLKNAYAVITEDLKHKGPDISIINNIYELATFLFNNDRNIKEGIRVSKWARSVCETAIRNNLDIINGNKFSQEANRSLIEQLDKYDQLNWEIIS